MNTPRDDPHAVGGSFDLRSRNGGYYRIFFARPPGPEPERGYEPLVLLDGNAYFGAARDALNALSAFPLRGPVDEGPAPVLLVGVGYPSTDLLNQRRRTWDYLPPADDSSNEAAASLGATPGGADDFQRFLTGEMIDELRNRFPLRDERMTLAGHSLGAYFVLYTLATAPGSFARYAAISPSLWWQSDTIRHAVSESEFDPGSIRVLLATAANELPGYPDRSAMMRESIRATKSVLEAKGLGPGNFWYREVEGEDHVTTALSLLPSVIRLAQEP